MFYQQYLKLLQGSEGYCIFRRCARYRTGTFRTNMLSFKSTCESMVWDDIEDSLSHLSQSNFDPLATLTYMGTWTFRHVHAHARTHTNIRYLLHIHVHIYIHAYMYTYMCAHTYKHTSEHTVCMYIVMFIYTYIYIHIYIHTQALLE